MSLSKVGSKGSVLNELVSGKSFSVFKQLMTGAVQIYALSSGYEAIYINRLVPFELLLPNTPTKIKVNIQRS